MTATVTAGALGRDIRVMGLVGVAHFFSHFFQLVLPPLFPVLVDEFDIGFAELGLLATLFYGASGLMQTPAGFLVDRFGAGRVLIAGLVLLAGATGAMGFAPGYWTLVPLVVLAGIGNSVFHPADLAILTARISERRLGRGYSVHALMGNLGWAAAPALVIGLSHLWDWRTALVVLGGLGLAAALLIATQGETLGGVRRRPAASAPAARVGADVLLSGPVVACFLYFVFLAMALIGVQTFSATAMVQAFGVELPLATAALTGFLIASAAGIAVGGVLADRTDRHDRLAIAGLLAAAALMLAVSLQVLPTWAWLTCFVATGFAAGMTTPSRDMLVRAATPQGSAGRVFGFVYSGLDLGSALMPVTLGLLVDAGRAGTVFLAVAVLMAATSLTVVQVRRRTPARAAVAAGD